MPTVMGDQEHCSPQFLELSFRSEKMSSNPSLCDRIKCTKNVVENNQIFVC